jgi:cytoskeleton protein RodZ
MTGTDQQNLQAPPLALEPMQESPPQPVSRVGDTLRDQRQSLSLSLTDIASTLRIRRDYLQALEEGHFEALPGRSYATGFLRTYAGFLGLDSKEIIRQYQADIARLTATPDYQMPTPLPEGRIPGGSVLAVAFGGALLIYALWYALSPHDRSKVEAPPPLPVEAPAAPQIVPGAVLDGTAGQTTAPSELAPSESAPISPDATPSPSGAAPAGTPPVVGTPSPNMIAPQAAMPLAPGQAQAQSPQPQQVQQAPQPTPLMAQIPAAAPSSPTTMAPAPVTTTAPAIAPTATPAPVIENITDVAPPPTALPPGQKFGTEAGARIVIRARADSWLQIRDKDGTRIMTRMMRAGDTYYVPNQPGLKLATGNAGALQITVDGAAAPDLGTKGEVRQDVPISPELLLHPTARP